MPLLRSRTTTRGRNSQWRAASRIRPHGRAIFGDFCGKDGEVDVRP